MIKKTMRGIAVAASLAAFLAPHAAAKEPAGLAELVIYQTGKEAAMRVLAADADRQQPLVKDKAVVPKAPGVNAQANNIEVSQGRVDGKAGALTLKWSNAWNASLRIESARPVDLRPYIPAGVLQFDLNVKDLANGGLGFKVNCGKECERQVQYLAQGRASAGQGWKRVAIAMSCFVRDGDDFSAIAQPFAVQAGGVGEVAVANVRFLKQGTPTAECPDYRTMSVTPDTLNEFWALPWWLPRHAQKLKEVRQRKAAGVDTEVVFIGDSITQGWEGEGASVWTRHYGKYNALNLGYGGDRTENVLWRLQHGEVDGLQPKVAVLLIGTNNTGHRVEDPRLIVAGVKRDLEELQQRLPGAKVLLLAIFPRDATPDTQLRRNNEQVNALLPALADNQRVFFANINHAFVGPDGMLSREVMPDLLHLNTRGYQLWAEAMEPALQKLLPQ